MNQMPWISSVLCLILLEGMITSYAFISSVESALQILLLSPHPKPTQNPVITFILMIQKNMLALEADESYMNYL